MPPEPARCPVCGAGLAVTVRLATLLKDVDDEQALHATFGPRACVRCGKVKRPVVVMGEGSALCKDCCCPAGECTKLPGHFGRHSEMGDAFEP